MSRTRAVTLVSPGHLLILELVVVYKSQKSIFVLEVKIFFTPFWKYRFWGFNLNFICMVALLRMKAGVPIVSEYYLPCIVIDVLFSHRSRLPRRDNSPESESEPNSTHCAVPRQWRWQCSSLCALLPSAEYSIVDCERYWCIIVNRFVWLCTMGCLYREPFCTVL